MSNRARPASTPGARQAELKMYAARVPPARIDPDILIEWRRNEYTYRYAGAFPVE
jgi:hypothetical protein